MAGSILSCLVPGHLICATPFWNVQPSFGRRLSNLQNGFQNVFLQCKLVRMPRLRQIRNSQFGSHRSKILSIFLPDLFLLALFSLALSSPLLAQSNPDSNDTGVQELYAQAKAAEARGDLAAAAQIYESLLQASPHLAPAYNNLGALYLKQHEYRKAATILERGLKIDPKMFSAFALLGIVRYEMGDYAGARRSLEAALHGNPKDGNVELFLANDLIKLDELDLAADHLRQLSQRQPRNQEIWYLLGKVHMKLSEQALSKLNEIDPNSVWSHEISGEVMESMKNYDGALIEYKKAVALAPNQPGIHYLLGNAYWALANWSDAAREFRTEIANDPSNCAAQWKIANTILEQRLDPAAALSNA